ncbi:unnamed protein product, partial [Meganyctiphanes norvegica]
MNSHRDISKASILLSSNYSWSPHSMRSRSPVPLSRSGSWRQQRMFEGPSLSIEELRMAAMQGNLIVVKNIIQQKRVHVDQILKSGWTALMYSSSCGKSEVVQWLLQEKADVNLHKELFTALMAACASSQPDEESLFAAVQLLLEYGAQVDGAERHRMTALMFASKEGRAAIVERLLKAKADVDKQDNKGWTALCWAATKGHGKVVRILLQHSADTKLLNNHGQRASDIALAAGYPEIASILENLLLKENVEEENLKNLDSTSNRKLSSESVNKRISHKYGELEMVLTGLELSDLIDLFHKHQISFEQFLRLNEKDLETMGVEALGHRKTIVEAIKEIHKKDWQTSSLPSIKKMTHITVFTKIRILISVRHKLKTIHQAINYIIYKLRPPSLLVKVGTPLDLTTLKNLCTHTGENIINANAQTANVTTVHTGENLINANAQPAQTGENQFNAHTWENIINTNAQPANVYKFVASNGWFSGWKSRFGMTSINLKGPQQFVILDI